MNFTDGTSSSGRLLWQAMLRFNEHHMSTYAAALAFRGLFAIFPFILFLLALFAFIGEPQFFDWLRDQASVMVPAQAMRQVDDVLAQLRQPQGGLLSVGIAGALWVASSGTRAAMEALNVAYGVQETRSFAARLALSVFYTIGLAMLLMLAVLLLTIGPDAAQWIAQQVGLGQQFVLLWRWLRWPLWVLLLCASIALIYYAGPNRRQHWRLLLPGALVCVLSWAVASIAFEFYLSNFANYSALYGGIGAVIALLLYFSISASVLLFGAEFNAVLEQRAGIATSASRSDDRVKDWQGTLSSESPPT